MQTTKNKIRWVSILQGWAMLWVVIGHAPLGEPGNGPEWENVLYHFAYSFHMPLFMLVSGYLFYLTRLGTWNYLDTIKDKAKRLLIPMLTFTLLAFAAKLLAPSEMNRPTGFGLNELVDAFLYPEQSPLKEMWFIASLFWLFLLMPLWKWSIKRTWTMYVLLSALVFLHFIHPDVQFLCIGKMCSYAVYFYGGVLMSRTLDIERFRVMGKWWLLPGGILCYAAGYLMPFPFIETLGGIALSIALALLFDDYIPKAFFSFRDYTYQIFLMGIFVQVLVKIVFRRSHMAYLPAFTLSIISALYIPVLISVLAKSIAWKPLLVCLGIKPEKKY